MPLLHALVFLTISQTTQSLLWSRNHRNQRDSNSCRHVRGVRRGSTSTTASSAEDAGEVEFPLALDDLLLRAGIDHRVRNVTAERISSAGAFCNSVYRINVHDRDDDDASSASLIMIAKIFSPVALARMDPQVATVGEIDQLVAREGLSPRLFASTDCGILSEFCPGRLLTEQDIHQRDNAEECALAAQALAKLHLIKRETTRGVYHKVNTLWHACERMLDMCHRQFSYQGWSIDRLRQELDQQRNRMDGQNLPFVDVGHGDFKPSNVILRTDPLHRAVTLIDLELAGAHYRAFDLAKFFRTDNPTLYTENNQLVFYSAYADVFGQGATLDEIQWEVDLIRPLTWLEASIFFACMACNDPSNADRWDLLAEERLQSYSRSIKKKV